MLKRILYLFLTLFIIFIVVGLTLMFYKSQKNTKEVILYDIVDDPLANFSEGRKIFNINCAACHRIEAISDPDILRNLNTRMNKDYFYLFITKQDSLIENEDEYATKIGSYFDFSHIAISHKFDSLTQNDVNNIYDYIIAVKNKN